MTVSGNVHAVERDEAALVWQAHQGDERAWEALVQAHQAAAFRLAYLITADADEAHDVAQEAFWRAYRSLERFDATRPFRPWLLSITRNVARNQRRALGRRLAALQRWWRQQPQPATGVTSTADTVAKRQQAGQLWQAVQQLKPGQQEVIYLRHFLALSEAETAAALAIAPGTVKSRSHRALQQLRTIIEVDFPELKEAAIEDGRLTIDD